MPDDFDFELSIPQYPENITVALNNEVIGPYKVLTGYDIWKKEVDDPFSSDPEDTIHDGTEIRGYWRKKNIFDEGGHNKDYSDLKRWTPELGESMVLIYEATDELPEPKKGDSFQVCFYGGYETGWTEFYLSYVAIKESQAKDMTYELEYHNDPN